MKRAKYGRQSDYLLKLAAGNYALTYAMAAWKKVPNYKVQILDANGTVVAESESYDATPNADGSKSANLSAAEKRELPFTIEKAGNYVISFQNTSTFEADYHEFLLMECTITEKEITNSIKLINAEGEQTGRIYGIGGERRTALQQGVNIIRTKDGKTKKIMVNS